MSFTFIVMLGLISTHTLRKEGDVDIIIIGYVIFISTHTLRKEGDISFVRTKSTISHFNPHPPQGG